MQFFKSKVGDIPLPVFFPDATRGVIKTLDTKDIESTNTKGILVNTFHLWQELDVTLLNNIEGIRGLMNWKGAVISDSGGFQVMSIVKSGKISGKITDSGVEYKNSSNKKYVLTPEKSVEFQLSLDTDMVVVLDDFTKPDATYKEALETIKRTITWAERSKLEFDRKTKSSKTRPYLLGVVQGGKYQDLRKQCIKELINIGFDGLGYGGWPISENGKFDYESAKTIADNTPNGYILYALGIGKPEDIIGCVKLGFNVFDCVLPTRDARHRRLYVYNYDSIENIDILKKNLYSYFTPDKQQNLTSTERVSLACDCLLCKNYSKAYLAHLFKIGDFTAGRLSTIHNLRFYSILMEKIRESSLYKWKK